jgi:hypothetical protein
MRGRYLPLLFIVLLILLSSCSTPASAPSVGSMHSDDAFSETSASDTPLSASFSPFPTIPSANVYVTPTGLTIAPADKDNTGDGEDWDAGDDEEGDGDWEDGDEEGSDDGYGFPDETTSPHAMGFGSLPKSLLGINPVSTDNYSPDKVTDYLLSGLSEFQDSYFVVKAEVNSGKLYLYMTDDVCIDADKAYQYLKSTFSLSDSDIISLPLFSDDSCEIHSGKMYTSDEWDIENGIEPDDYDSEYDYNSVELKEIALPDPVPVAVNAQIVLVDYGEYFAKDDDETGCRITTKQFEDFLLYNNGENLEYLWNLWFKYSNGEITAIAEQYDP